MAHQRDTEMSAGHPRIYEIRVKGHLGREWSDWFEGLTIVLEDNGHTRLTGPVADQAALHGLLRKVRDLGMPLLSVVCVEPGPGPASLARYGPLTESKQAGGDS